MTDPQPREPGPLDRALRGRGRKKRLKAASALVHQYVPPSPDKMQAAMAAGKITITPGGSSAIPASHLQVQTTNSNYQKIAN